jgi:ATP-dependent RNA helicase RhlE
MSFSNLGLSPALCAPLARLGYESPTPVQVKAIPVVLTGADLLARAQTGTGKTAAFGLPMIERLSARPSARGEGQRSRGPRALVLVPTRELAAQVHKSLTTYGAPMQMRVAVLFGGVGMGAQIDALRRGAEIVVATPGRLIDHMQRRTIDLSAIEILTLDEADRMLDLGFMPALRRISAALPRQRQTLMFSATFSDEVVKLSADFTRQPARVDVSDGQPVASTVTHQVHNIAMDQKREVLTHVLTESAGQTLVFCKTKRGADRVGQHLERAGIHAGVIHGNKSQGARTRVLGDFKSGRLTVLVATDIAARGLDIKQLPLVVNFDLPLVAEDYIHRIGRTGRAGHAGRAVSLVSHADAGLLRDIQRLLPTRLEPVALAGFAAPQFAASSPAPSERRADRRPEQHRERQHRGGRSPQGERTHHGERSSHQGERQHHGERSSHPGERPHHGERSSHPGERQHGERSQHQREHSRGPRWQNRPGSRQRRAQRRRQTEQRSAN